MISIFENIYHLRLLKYLSLTFSKAFKDNKKFCLNFSLIRWLTHLHKLASFQLMYTNSSTRLNNQPS